MAKTIFEQIDGTYTLQGDYYLPDLTLPAVPSACGNSATDSI